MAGEIQPHARPLFAKVRRSQKPVGKLGHGARWRFLWYFQARPGWTELLKWPAAAPGLFPLTISQKPLWTRITAATKSEIAEKAEPCRPLEFGQS